MKVLPIPFSPPMSRAVLDGTKTQTRRGLVRLRRFGKVTQFGASDTAGYDWHFRDPQERWHDLRHAELLKALPYEVGDILWVREHWRAPAHHDTKKPIDLDPRSMTIRFEAGGYISNIDFRGDYRPFDEPNYAEGVTFGRERRGMHLPRWASRTTLEVTEVRVELLQEISEADARAEGVSPLPSGRYHCGFDDEGEVTCRSPVTAYAWIWNAINGEDAWSGNPWVAAYTFTVHRKNVDDMLAERASGARP